MPEIRELNPTPSPIIEDKIAVVTQYKYYVKENNIKLPYDAKERRIEFINYYINKDSDVTIPDKLKELANNHLFITTRTIDDLIF